MMWYRLAKKKVKTFGYHLILNLAGCNGNISSEGEIRKFLKEMVKKIEMKAVGEPIIRMMLSGQKNGGFSAMQLIETSDITCHFVESNSTAYIDIFSCKEYNREAVVGLVREYFEPKEIKEKFLYRDAEEGILGDY